MRSHFSGGEETMSTITLKTYQQRALDSLTSYLSDARLRGAKEAYDRLDKSGLRSTKLYQAPKGLDAVPYVCLRLPTGGGKTLLSAHSVKIAAENYLETEYPLVIWFTPTDKIRTQTLETLKDPHHANYEVLHSAFDGRFMVLDATDFKLIRPQDLVSKAVVIVATMQTFRVDSTEGRKVYDHNEDLEPHFSKVTRTEGLELKEGGNKIRYSFRNLLALHRPLVICDEAHNSTSDLSYEVYRRVNPACIIEFTATPVPESNILCHVSASELKAEEMIKLPIVLGERNTWQEAVRDAVLTRQRLADIAKADGQYIRPIVLFQAENKDKTVTVDVLTAHLVENEKIDRERIAVVTGDQKELDGINLFDPSCKIDFVITIQALKEGWDCSFAYVFCSVATVHSKKDVEQLLGRVLRMPYAKRRTQPDLNKAYAYVASATWKHAVNYLHDRLVEMGFDEQETREVIETSPLNLNNPNAPLLAYRQPAPVVFELSEPPSLPVLSPEENKIVRVEQTSEGKTQIVIDGELSEEAQAKIVAVLPRNERGDFKTRLQIYQAEKQKARSPAERKDPFNVPQLCVLMDDMLELAERDVCLPDGWDLASYPAEAGSEFSLSEDGKLYEIDIQNDRLRERLVGNTDQLNLDLVDTGWTDLQLSRWLNRAIQQNDQRKDLSYEALLEHCRKFIQFMLDTRGAKLPSLVRGRFIIARFLGERIKRYRQAAYDAGFQRVLFDNKESVQTSYQYDFSFGVYDYAPKWTYGGSFELPKHYYPVIGELKSSGEEFECAKAIAHTPKIKYWVRNIVSARSFWLPTSTDNFYPDFVALLDDGRVLVVEYKGEDRETNDDSKEKRNIGELWEERSPDKKALFLMAVKEDTQGRNVYQQIEKKLK
jgi:type III restriction enzyme